MRIFALNRDPVLNIAFAVVWSGQACSGSRKIYARCSASQSSYSEAAGTASNVVSGQSPPARASGRVCSTVRSMFRPPATRQCSCFQNHVSGGFTIVIPNSCVRSCVHLRAPIARQPNQKANKKQESSFQISLRSVNVRIFKLFCFSCPSR